MHWCPCTGRRSISRFTTGTSPCTAPPPRRESRAFVSWSRARARDSSPQRRRRRRPTGGRSAGDLGARSVRRGAARVRGAHGLGLDAILDDVVDLPAVAVGIRDPELFLQRIATVVPLFRPGRQTPVDELLPP